MVMGLRRVTDGENDLDKGEENFAVIDFRQVRASLEPDLVRPRSHAGHWV